jgi:hypothetical protein
MVKNKTLPLSLGAFRCFSVQKVNTTAGGFVTLKSMTPAAGNWFPANSRMS